MLHAPTPALSSVRRYLSDGKRGVFETVECMRRAVHEARCNLAIRQAAISVIYLTPEKMERNEAGALFEYVRDHVRYVRDIVDVETLTAPEKTLQALIGDCDDQSALLAALLESVGYPTRFVVAAYNVPDYFEHVYLEVFVNGEWFALDPTERDAYFGWAPPNPLTIMTERA